MASLQIPISCAARPTFRLLALALPLLFAASAFAQDSPHAQKAQAKEQSLANGVLSNRKIANPGPADVKHGETVALGKAGCNAGQVCGCFQCHGLQGQGNPGAGFPRIGAQSYLYLDESLANFASGRRVSQVMQPIARQLSAQDRRDVAAYYASLRPQHQGMAQAAAAKNHPTPEMLTRGGVLAAVGSAPEGVQACQNCHGPAGAGLPPVYPFLAGQYAAYIEGQMQAFRAGKRQGDAFDIMQDIARRMSDKDIAAVAQYYASIRPERTVTQSKLGPAVQVGAPLGPEPGTQSTSGQGQKQ